MAEARDAVSARVRADLLDGVRQHRREFETAGDKAQELRTLPAETERAGRERLRTHHTDGGGFR